MTGTVYIYFVCLFDFKADVFRHLVGLEQCFPIFFSGDPYFKSHKPLRPKPIDIIRKSQNKGGFDHYWTLMRMYIYIYILFLFVFIIIYFFISELVGLLPLLISYLRLSDHFSLNN